MNSLLLIYTTFEFSLINLGQSISNLHISQLVTLTNLVSILFFHWLFESIKNKTYILSTRCHLSIDINLL